MTARFPESPFRDHAFVAAPASGNLYDATGENAWIVVLQRDGTIKGPAPALRYPPSTRGLPNDVVAYHLLDPRVALAIFESHASEVLSTRRSRATRRAVRAAAVGAVVGAVGTTIALMATARNATTGSRAT